MRPAVVLDLVDRLCYQALVDRHSVGLIGDLSPSVYGWRLVPGKPEQGKYSQDSLQWDNYRSHLEDAAGWYNAALRTDIVSCFASLDPTVVLDEVSTRVGKNALIDRLASFLGGFDRLAARSGLPQRARPSSVLANMVLRHFDDVLAGYAEEIPHLEIFGEEPPTARMSYVRWMDDMWLFGDDASSMRRAQLELQRVAEGLGLHLNSSKTEVLEGSDVSTVAMELELSAIDTGLKTLDLGPLEELIDQVVEAPDTAGRTKVKFMVGRMLKNDVTYREQDLLFAAKRMPHCADSLAVYFRARFIPDGLQEWFLSGVSDSWNLLQWPQAQYFGMFDSSKPPVDKLLEFAETTINDMNAELPVLAVSAQRLAAWSPARARNAISSSITNRVNPNERRVLSLAALSAGESKYMVRKWLKQEDGNAPTLAMLDKEAFHAPKVNPVYLAAGPSGA